VIGPRRAISFLTPFGGAVGPGPDAVMWFPMVGVVLGLGLGGFWWTVDKAWSPLLAAALVVVADLAVTGLLHADGLVDSADGLLPHLSKERRLEVMAMPDAGAFGVWVVVAVFALRWGALATMRPAPFLLAGLWCASRTAMAFTIGRVPYARPNGGLATAFGPGLSDPVLVLGVPAALLLAAGWRLGVGPLAVVVGLLAFAGVVLLARRRIGGFTGDVLGAAGMVGETVGLVVAAAKW
jgi:adenosylcobinamide-GDP ribazoletransferase